MCQDYCGNRLNRFPEVCSLRAYGCGGCNACREHNEHTSASFVETFDVFMKDDCSKGCNTTISQLSRGSSSHVRLDDVTGGASAMVAAPVPADRLSQVVPSEGAPLDSDESSGIERTMTMSV